VRSPARCDTDREKLHPPFAEPHPVNRLEDGALWLERDPRRVLSDCGQHPVGQGWRFGRVIAESFLSGKFCANSTSDWLFRSISLCI